MKINRKIIIGLMVTLLIVLGFQLRAFYQSHKELQVLEGLQNQSEQLLQEIESFFEDTEQGFLKDNLKVGDITNLENQLIAHKKVGSVDTELEQQLSRLKRHYQAREKLFSLFEMPENQSKEWDQPLKYRSDLTSEEFARIRNEIIFVKPQDAFENRINFYLKLIENELDIYEEGLRQLEYLEYIPINVRNYSLIARTIRQAELAAQEVNNQSFKEDIQASIQNYSDEFIEATQIHWQELPEEYVLEQLSFSDYLSEAFYKALKDQNQQETQEEEETHD